MLPSPLNPDAALPEDEGFRSGHFSQQAWGVCNLEGCKALWPHCPGCALSKPGSVGGVIHCLCSWRKAEEEEEEEREEGEGEERTSMTPCRGYTSRVYPPRREQLHGRARVR